MNLTFLTIKVWLKGSCEQSMGKKHNSIKHKQTKATICCCLLQHSSRKWGGIILQFPRQQWAKIL